MAANLNPSTRRAKAVIALQQLGYEAGQSLRAVTVAAVAFIVILIGASVWVARKEQAADDAVAHTVRNTHLLSVLQAMLQDAEIGQRGYLLTGDGFYLEPYTSAVKTVDAALDELAAGVSDNRRQDGNIAVLRSLAAQKLSELRQSVERRRDGDEMGALAVLRTGQGKVLMDGVRDILGRMGTEEEAQMSIRASQARGAGFRMEVMVIGLAMVAAAMGLIAAWATLRRARSAEALRDELLARLDRRLLAIMAADVVGYSRMMERDETRTLLRLKRLRDRIDPIISHHGGTIVTTAGDSVLAAFASALSAVDCAVEVQSAAVAENAEVPEGERLALRIGINVGDVIVQDGDVFGDAVNIAARLEPLAEPGGICISRAVRDHVRKQPNLSFDDLGFQTVKNIARPVSAFRVRVESALPRAKSETSRSH